MRSVRVVVAQGFPVFFFCHHIFFWQGYFQRHTVLTLKSTTGSVPSPFFFFERFMDLSS